MKKFLVILCLFLTACNSKEVEEVSGVRTEEFVPYVINVQANREKALWEKEKCMSGAYIDREYAFKNIKEFEKLTEVENDVYIKKLGVNDEFPSKFIIETYASGKTPMLIIKQGMDIKTLETIARKCNNIGVPILISFDYGNATELYNVSAEIFRNNAPKAALMWQIPYNYKREASPEDKYIDWVTLEISEKACKTNISELRDTIKYFENKAVAINVSLECFSGEDHKYYTKEWGGEIKEIYSLASDYENVALINYTENSENNRVYGSSKLSDSEEIQKYYKEAVDTLPNIRKWTSIDCIGYVSNDTAYINTETAELLNIEKHYANSNYIATKNYSVDNLGRKMFVY